MRFLSDWFLRQITRPRRNYRRFVYNDPQKLKARIEPGDVLLVDGDQRVSEAVKYLTQSSWSHSALFIGDALLRRDEATRRETLRRFGRESRFLIVEALVEKGVIASPLIKYVDFNVRVCRPIGLRPADREIVLGHVLSRIGHTYDRRNFLDLTRYVLPFHMIPPRLREDALHFGSGLATETICSTLLAEAFAAVRFPILPVPLRERPRTLSSRVRQRAARAADPARLQRPPPGPAPHPVRSEGLRSLTLLRHRQVSRAGARRARLPQVAMGGGTGAACADPAPRVDATVRRCGAGNAEGR